MILMGTNIGKDIDGVMHTWIAPLVIKEDYSVVGLLGQWRTKKSLIDHGFMFYGDFPLCGHLRREEWFPQAQVADWLTDYLNQGPV